VKGTLAIRYTAVFFWSLTCLEEESREGRCLEVLELVISAEIAVSMLMNKGTKKSYKESAKTYRK